jgi:hypothetical protein
LLVAVLPRGEYFAMQSDAHVAFVRDWDAEIIEQWHSAKNEMAILSNYLSGTSTGQPDRRAISA